MKWQERIVVNPSVLVGKPVIRGTRLAVEFIVELLSEGWSTDDIIKNYPPITKEDIQAALRYASEVLKTEMVFPLATGTGG